MYNSSYSNFSIMQTLQNERGWKRSDWPPLSCHETHPKFNF
jgi:hypothetical protein